MNWSKNIIVKLSRKVFIFGGLLVHTEEIICTHPQTGYYMSITQEYTPAIKVMVIEDNKPMQLVLSHHLNSKYQVTIFPDGFEAMAYLHEGNVVDIIISDLNTPRMNGYELLDQLRASGFFSSIPIIVLSGEESTDTRIKCLEAGADDYLVKPFNPRELLARINAILRRTGKISTI